MRTYRLSPGLKSLALVLVLAAAGMSCAKKTEGPSYDVLLKTFADPPAEYRSAPLWVWNDLMTRDAIKRQLEDFKARGIGGAFIHPRPGLITPYLNDEWFSLCAYAVETGKALGLKIWLYDENSYPSGFAGGHVPAAMPDAGRSGLKMRTFEGPPPALDPAPAVILRRTLTGFEDVTGKVPAAGSDGAVYYVFDVVRAAPSPWHGGFTYVDIMRKEVTEKFLDLTLNGYKKWIGKEFGLTVPGVFQDEAEISPAGGREAVNYTPALLPAFQTRWGYDLRPHLVALFEEVGNWKRVRHDFYATLLDLLIENWAKPYFAYAADNKLAFTGHYWEHEWPRPRVVPDSLALGAYAHMPGIDILMNVWETDPHAQFGNARAVREIRSVANQLGRERTMSETYGAGGWDMTFADQKRIGDWEYALGVNFLNQHLSYATIKGARKRDHPLSFSDHEPWWERYNTLADYFGRLSVAMSLGRQVNKILVIEPTTTAWMYYSPAGDSEAFRTVGDDFQAFVHLLEAEQVEYDLVSEKTLQEFGTTSHGRVNVGSRSYGLVIFPPGMRNLEDSTVALVRDYLIRDGKIISWVTPPDYVNGIPTEDLRVLQESFGDRWLNSGPGSGFDKVRMFSPPAVTFTGLPQTDKLFHQRREFDGGQIVFLANSDAAATSAGTMTVSGGSAEAWDPFTGRVEPYPFVRRGGKLELAFSLPPGGSLLLCIREERARPAEAPTALAWEDLPAEGGLVVEPLAPNVLTLDYCDLVLRGRTEKDLYFYDAQRKTFEAHGLGRNPWDSAVQYKTNILDKDKFPADSGFEAVFWFRAGKEDAHDFEGLKAVVERPELFRVFVNDREVKASAGEWWLDRAFGVFPVGARVVSGRNKITVKSRPFTIHSELEPVYLLGDFRLAAAARGFELRPPAPLGAGPWKAQGWPFYGAAVRYRKTVVVSADGAGAAYRLKLGPWLGATAEVFVGDKRVGTVAFAPYEIDLTGALAAGPNEVSVVVYGTLKNTLGPFHNDPPLGRAWPGSFQQGAKGGPPPGSGYSSVDYGLFEDFRVSKGIAR
jgi:alpha-L-rhamnosidase